MPGYKRLGGEFLITVQRKPGHTEFECVDEWLNEVLSGDAPLTTPLAGGSDGIWEGNSPEGINHPSVSFWFDRAAEDDATGPTHAANLIYVVEGWDEENYAQLFPIAARLYDLLEMGIEGKLERPEGWIYSCERLRPWRGANAEG